MDQPPTSRPATPEAAAAPSSETSQPDAAKDRVSGWTFLVGAVIAVAVLTLQTLPTEIETNADISLGAVLAHAHQHHWQFGRDVVFTYGPLGFLTFFYYGGYAKWACLLANAAVCLAAGIGVALVAWKISKWWRWWPLLLFLFAACNLEPRTDLIFDTNLFCWGLLCFVETGRRLSVSVTALVVVSVFSGLAKISYLFPAFAIVVLVTAHLLVNGRRGVAVALVGGFALLFIGTWLVAGQDLGGLGPFIINSLAIVSAYNHALGWEGVQITRQIGLVLGGLTAVLIVVRASAFKPTATSLETEQTAVKATIYLKRGLILFWALGFTFVVWKHSFFRADFVHAGYFLGFVPVLALGLAVLPGQSSTVRKWSIAISGVLCLSAVITLQWYFLPALPSSLFGPARLLAYHARTLVRPSGYWRDMDATLESMQREARLPGLRKIVGQATVDFFGNNQVYVVANDLNYHPAPVFQSYAVCDERLAELNESFYASKAAPEYVIFVLGTMDRKFPPLDNSRVLRDVLAEYEPAGTEGRFVLLKIKRPGRPALELIKEGVVGPSEPINVMPYIGTNLWLEIELRPTLAGKLRQAVYRAPVVRLGVWSEPGGKLLHRNRAPASNLAAGFVASPLLMQTSDVQDFYYGKPVMRPGAYSIDLMKGEEHWWQPEIRYRLYRIESSR